MKTIPATWATDLIDPAWAAERVSGLPTWTRWRPYEATRMLAKTLARHMGTDALPALRAMIAAAPERGFNWQQIRDAGEAMVWLCHQHPSLTPEATAFMTAEREAHTTGQSASELEIVRGALARGARHLWSNG